MKENYIEEYEINPYTMFIRPVVYGSKVYSQIFEVEDEFLSPIKPLDLIKKSCNYLGSNYEGRKYASKQLIGVTHKIPVALDPTNRIFFFPTKSPNHPDCFWFSLEHINFHKRISSQEILVVLRNGQSFSIPISFSIFQKQLEKTALLSSQLMRRIEQNEKRSFYLLNRPVAMEAREEFSSLWRKR